MMTLITGLVGIAILLGYLGILLWWIRALPLVIIVVAVVLMLLQDFVQTIRSGDSGAGRGGPVRARAALPRPPPSRPRDSRTAKRQQQVL
jgi:hypothetical protein